MFERFTEPARAVVTRAQDEARSLRHEAIGCEHLLIAAASAPADDPAAGALRRAGLDAGTLRAAVSDVTARRGLDAEALAAIGIDLDEVRRRVEDAFGPGALERRRAASRSTGDPAPVPFTANAKKALELALRYAVHRGDRHIGSEHVLMGVLRAVPGDSVTARVLERAGADPRALREMLEAERSS